MQHPYSEHAGGFRVFYILLLTAHSITRLILHGSLIKSLCRTFGSAKNFGTDLAAVDVLNQPAIKKASAPTRPDPPRLPNWPSPLATCHSPPRRFLAAV
jgi:hypothetical protein